MNLKAIPIMLAMIPSVLRGVGRQDLERIKTITRQAYPSVPQVDPGTLAEWMGSPDLSLFLVDVRSPAEYAVSALRGAVNLQTATQISRAMTERNPGRTILYCSVGFRSSRLAHLVAQRGGRNVFNLEGSIFQWANEGRAVYQGDEPVKQVHPYGKRWRGLLKDGLAGDGGRGRYTPHGLNA